MILSWEDIAGGETIAAFLVWLVLTGLFYLVCYIAVLNVIDDLSRNSSMKVPMMFGASIPTAGLMAIFGYKPLVWVVLVAVANYFRVRELGQPGKKLAGLAVNRPLFYMGSYLYIAMVGIMAFYFQSPSFHAILEN